eukprot:scaffold13309_cov79-Skeletonema_dohrnii-CCMP3373.AAC.1
MGHYKLWIVILEALDTILFQLAVSGVLFYRNGLRALSVGFVRSATPSVATPRVAAVSFNSLSDPNTRTRRDRMGKSTGRYGFYEYDKY